MPHTGRSPIWQTMINGPAISEFRSYRMSTDKVDQAYPLVRELRRKETLQAWRIYAQSYLALKLVKEGHRGILVAEHRGYIRGLLSYDILPNWFDHKVMTVRDVIIPVLPAGQPAARCLLEELLEISEAHRCVTISVDLTKGMEWLAREWSDPAGRLFRVPVTCFFTVPREPISSETVQHRQRPHLRLVEQRQ